MAVRLVGLRPIDMETEGCYRLRARVLLGKAGVSAPLRRAAGEDGAEDEEGVLQTENFSVSVGGERVELLAKGLFAAAAVPQLCVQVDLLFAAADVPRLWPRCSRLKPFQEVASRTLLLRDLAAGPLTAWALAFDAGRHFCVAELEVGRAGGAASEAGAYRWPSSFLGGWAMRQDQLDIKGEEGEQGEGSTAAGPAERLQQATRRAAERLRSEWWAGRSETAAAADVELAPWEDEEDLPLLLERACLAPPLTESSGRPAAALALEAGAESKASGAEGDGGEGPASGADGVGGKPEGTGEHVVVLVASLGTDPDSMKLLRNHFAAVMPGARFILAACSGGLREGTQDMHYLGVRLASDIGQHLAVLAEAGGKLARLVMLCYVMLCYVMLCYIIVCYSSVHYT